MTIDYDVSLPNIVQYHNLIQCTTRTSQKLSIPGFEQYL
ncbi:MAG: hypothetical protein ACI8RD_014093 [Bacillariaceae sp.]|jgi:hypothetical protein